MVKQHSRRHVIQACVVGLGASVAGCTFVNGQPEEGTSTEMDKSPTETETATETPPTECSTNHLTVRATSGEELEGEAYEKRLYEDLSSEQQDQFRTALNGGQPRISDEHESDWYGTITYKGNERRIQLVIDYETELYKIEVEHHDRC